MEKEVPPPSYSPQVGWTPQTGFTPAQTYQPSQPATCVISYTQPQPPVIPIGNSSTACIISYPPPEPVIPVGNSSSVVTCPSCRKHIRTELRREASTRTHLMALLLCCFGCWPCVCLPYCMDSCQNANHYCPNCNAFIGTYQS